MRVWSRTSRSQWQCVPVLKASGLLGLVVWQVKCMVGLTAVSPEALAAIHMRDAFVEQCVSCPPSLLWAVSTCSAVSVTEEENFSSFSGSPCAVTEVLQIWAEC